VETRTGCLELGSVFPAHGVTATCECVFKTCWGYKKKKGYRNREKLHGDPKSATTLTTPMQMSLTGHGKAFNGGNVPAVSAGPPLCEKSKRAILFGVL